MFSHLSLRHQYAFLGIAGLALVAMAAIGGNYLRQPAPMTLTPRVEKPSRAQEEKEPSPQASLDAPAAATTEVVVHVAGAVKKPTVVTMHPGNRVHEAIGLAGGATADADLEAVNLAARLEDGTQLYIPRKNERETEPAPAYRGGPKAPRRYSTRSSKASPGKATAGRPVSLNTGTLADFDTLPGIGPATAQKILDYRHAHGGFSSIDELLAIPGFGPSRLEKVRKWLTL